MSFKLALAQIAPRLGEVQENLQKHLDYIARAQDAHADLLVFPELSLSGYYLKDLAADVALAPRDDNPIFAALLKASHSLDLVVGFPEVDERYRYFISAAYLSGGRLAQVHRKAYLPTYRLFDDARFFGAGDAIRAFDTRFGRMGILICEDAWHLSAPYLLWRDGAEFLIDISASPGYGVAAQGLPTKMTVDAFLQTYAELLTMFVVYVNRVGVEDGVTFWGGSLAIAPDGERLASAPDFEEALIVVEMDTDRLRRARLRFPSLRDERIELVQRELQILTPSRRSRTKGVERQGAKQKEI